MIQKKICMLGSFAVGKTSLVARFVRGIFSEDYLTTIGVKIDKKRVEVAGEPIDLILWDLNGQDRFLNVSTSYLRGSAGYLLVADGTRKPTLDVALSLHEKAQSTVGEVPCLLLLNKDDLVDDWEIDDEALAALEARGLTIVRTSAKTGTMVDEAFETLARQLVLPQP